MRVGWPAGLAWLLASTRIRLGMRSWRVCKPHFQPPAVLRCAAAGTFFERWRSHAWWRPCRRSSERQTACGCRCAGWLPMPCHAARRRSWEPCAAGLVCTALGAALRGSAVC